MSIEDSDIHDTTIIRSKLAHVDDLQDYYDALNELEKQNDKLKAFVMEPSTDPLDRWPTLFEILNKKTQAPLDLWSFYVYMRDEQHSIDYIDFWIDTVQHINLCKCYVQGLRASLAANSRINQADQVTQILNSNDQTKLTISEDEIEPPQTKFNIKSDNANEDLKNRNSQASSRNSKSSSMLLDLLMKNDFFEGQDPHRLSTFLRGESSVRTSDPLVNAKIDQLKRKSHIFQSSNNITQINVSDNTNLQANNSFRVSKINPEMVETLIQDDFDKSHRPFDKANFISRVSLRKSTHNIVDTYFSEDSNKRIIIPQEMIDRIKFAADDEGRDDPEVFDEAREYVFKAMEYDAYPNFLRNNALKNVTKKSAVIRIMLSMICGFGAFWTGYTLIFMDYQPKPTRAVVVLPFFFMSYFFFSAFYRVDPLLCYAGFSESYATPGGIIPIKEPYVKKLLRKRSLFVMIIFCAVAASFSILFALVPGKRLTKSS